MMKRTLMPFLSQFLGDRRSDTRRIFDHPQAHARYTGITCDSGNGDSFQFLFSNHMGPAPVVQAAANLQRDFKPGRDLNTSSMQDSGPDHCILQHLVVADPVQQASLWNHSWIGRKHAVHVGEDLTLAGSQGSSYGCASRIRTPAAQGRDFMVIGDPLKARHNDDLALVQMTMEPIRIDPSDSSPGEVAICPNTALSSGQGNGLRTNFVESHGQEGTGNLFSRGQQQIQLPRPGSLSDFLCQSDQLVGGLSHG